MARKSLSVLYVGPNEGTSRHRYNALCRCRYNAYLIDPYVSLVPTTGLSALASKVGFVGFQRHITRFVLQTIGSRRFDIIWVDQGQVVNSTLAAELKRRCGVLICHNLDNPFVKVNNKRWRLLLEALPSYDVFVTPRATTRAAAIANGAKKAVVVWQAADEIVHQPCELSASEAEHFESQVVFAGTWMPGRDEFMARLVQLGVPIRIWGSHWTKAPKHESLQSVIRGGDLDDYSYVRAIASAKIALCQLSIDNEDVHTTRTFEIPSIGTLLCAPRTPDHLELYEDGSEAVFFDDAEECAELCKNLLRSEDKWSALAAAGHKRCLVNGRFNERVAKEIISHALGG